MDITIDPYEQQLLNVFSSHDKDSSGSLDRESLIRLCDTLQLEERGRQLLQYLLGDSSNVRITFREFKDGLLKILSPDNKVTDSEVHSLNENSGGDSSDREVSPKLVLGAKKYGRRSRPHSIDNGTKKSDLEYDNKRKTLLKSVKESKNGVQRSASQSEVHGLKRSGKLKRCASLPAYKSGNKEIIGGTATSNSVSDEEINCLRETWQSFVDVGSDGRLNQSKLVKVCECIGLQRHAIDSVTDYFENLGLDRDGKISFEEFLHLFRNGSDYTMNDEADLNDTLNNSRDDNGCIMDEPTSKSPTPNWPNDKGIISLSTIADMWKGAGVKDPVPLLQELGFDGPDISVSDLSAILEEELRELHDIGEFPKCPLTPLLQGSLALQRAELGALRQALRQLAHEGIKLRSDSRDANQRAALLAQEVDERHATLEAATRGQIRQLEQRHSEVVREIMSQITAEREQMANNASRLESRLANLEDEEQRLRTELEQACSENNNLEKEQRTLQEKIIELEESKICLLKEVKLLHGEKEKDCDKIDQQEMQEMLELLEKISVLQSENKELRDKNDELAVEVENLTTQLSCLKIKKNSGSMEASVIKPEIVTGDCDITGIDQGPSVAMKRRGDSPSKTRVCEESPRLGKLRKCNSDDKGCSKTNWRPLDTDLQQQTVTNNMDDPVLLDKGGPIQPEECEEVFQLKARVNHLESLLACTKVVETDSDNATSNELSLLQNEHGFCRDEKQHLEERCKQLESSLELLRNEYERCEDYWASKLDEERQIYEQEQRISDDKFSELIKKLTEYEEQFNSTRSGKLSPIQESCQLEQQFSDLEQEFEDFRASTEADIEAYNAEINLLKDQINLLEQTKILDRDINEVQSVQDDHIDSVVITAPVKEEIESPASSPIYYLWNQSTIQSPSPICTRDYQNPNFKSHDTTTSSNSKDIWKTENTTPTPIQKPVSTSTSADLPVTGSVPTSPKSVEVMKENVKHLQLKYQQLTEEVQSFMLQKDILMNELQILQSSKSTMEQNFNTMQQRTSNSVATARILQLEQRCRHLQSVLRQQQQYNESIMHQSWQQHRAEVGELRNRLDVQARMCAEQAQRLSRSDLLVKDLYCENAQLSASIQKLEQRCRMMSQSNHI